MASNKPVPVAEATDLEFPAHILDELESLLSSIEGGNGLIGMIEQILAAENEEQLAAIGSARGIEDFDGVNVRIDKIKKAESTKSKTMTHYLIAEGVVCRTGEAMTFTTGATQPVIMLLKAHSMGKMGKVWAPEVKPHPTDPEKKLYNLRYIGNDQF